MQLPPMRPSFAFDFPIDHDRAVELLTGIMDNHDHPIEGRVAGNHLMLVIPVRDRHFWSPWLNLEVLGSEGDGQASLVKGRFSPNPSVWTGFMMVYSSLAVLAFLAAMFGVSQLILHNPPWAFQIILVLVAIAGVMYWSSLIGQKIAQEQMQLLYRVTLETLGAGAGLESIEHKVG